MEIMAEGDGVDSEMAARRRRLSQSVQHHKALQQLARQKETLQEEKLNLEEKLRECEARRLHADSRSRALEAALRRMHAQAADVLESITYK